MEQPKSISWNTDSSITKWLLVILLKIFMFKKKKKIFMFMKLQLFFKNETSPGKPEAHNVVISFFCESSS